MEKPYIGITGLTNPLEAEVVAEIFESHQVDVNNLSYSPMAGVLVSSRTLNDLPPRKLFTPNIKYPNWRLVKFIFKKIKERVFTMVHYTSKEVDTLEGQIAHLFKGLYKEGGLYETGLCRLVQLNVPWPQVESLEGILRTFPEMKIVLQLSHKAMEEYSPADIAMRVSGYKGLIGYALIDPSGGRGLPFDLENSVAVYKAIKDKYPDLMLGFAGGFTGENVFDRVEELRRNLGKDRFCIDAEAGLRDQNQYIDCLALNKIKSYVKNSASAFSIGA